MAISTRIVALCLLILNFIIFTIVLALAGWTAHMSMDADFSQVSSDAGITFYTMEFALVAGAFGLASTIYGLLSVGNSKDSFGSTIAILIVSWILSLESLGLSSKDVQAVDFRSPKIKTLEALTIIMAGTQALHIICIIVGKQSGR